MATNQSDKYKTYPSENPTSQLDYIYTCNKGKYIIDSYHVIDAPSYFRSSTDNMRYYISNEID